MESTKQGVQNKDCFSLSLSLVNVDTYTEIMDPTNSEGETGKISVEESRDEKKERMSERKGGRPDDRTLGDSWTLWLDNGGSRRTQEEYERGTIEIATVNTIREFWKFWNQLAPLMGPLKEKKHKGNSKSSSEEECEESKGVGGVERCNICVFREGVRPSWEDPANLHGGSWTLKVPRSDGDKATSHVICEVIGRQLPVPRGVPGEEPICGVFVRVRGDVVAIDVWNRFTSPPEDINVVKEHLDRRIAEMGLTGRVLPVTFTPHNSPNKPSTSTMARRTSLLSESVNDLRSYALNDTAAGKEEEGARATPRRRTRAPPMLSSPKRLAVLLRPAKDDTPTSSGSSGSASTSTSATATPSDEGCALPEAQQASTDTTPRFPYSGFTPRAAGAGGLRSLNDHYRSVSVGGLASGRGATEAEAAAPAPERAHGRRPSGLQEALPILLRQGYAIPFAAYRDLAQAEALAAMPPGSTAAQACAEHLRQSSQSHARGSPMLPALPPDLLGHRRAYSLDRTALDEAYARYTEAKQAAFLRDQEADALRAAALPACLAPEWDESMGQEPIPGLGGAAGGDSTGLFGGLRNASVPRSSLAASAFSSEQGPFERLCGSCGVEEEPTALEQRKPHSLPEEEEHEVVDGKEDEEEDDKGEDENDKNNDKEEDDGEKDDEGSVPEGDMRTAVLVVALLFLVAVAFVVFVTAYPPTLD